jgi:hypothetical protein
VSTRRPLPYKAVKVYTGTPNAWQVQDANEWAVANRIDEETALEIVQAVNGREKLVEALEHIIKYWNRGENNGAMSDALYHMIETAEQALSEGGSP